MITAPFNFVPLSEKVFFPDWAENVSHDIPFEDGESGVIDITITAKSPMFIRDHENHEQFCQYKGEYYIPATSVKGMVRNVLEIMSFSKMSQFDDDTYAVRDLSKADNFYMKQMNLIDEPFTHCGWLKRVEGEYFIEDCGLPQRISHREIDKATGKRFAENFEHDGFEKTSEYKYNILGQTHQKIKVGEVYSSKTNAKYDKRKFCKYDKNGKEATLVVTGQPTKRQNTGKMGDGKGYEFIFLDPKEDLKVSKKVYENFLFAYFDGRETQPKESPDWKYWKEKLYHGEKVPVFFQKNGKQILHFGLSYLYKLPYKHSVKDGIKEVHFDNRLDLVQTLFGYIDKKKALKGRVQFSHFKAISNIRELNPRTEILGTPRASYYPIYVRQYNTDFKTFMDGSFDIAGWKRYPIHRGNNTTQTEDTGNENVGTTFKPLQHGVVFKGKLRYHNLKKTELGAILSALTFHNTPNTYHHIGMAKPLGYGKIEIKLAGLKDIKKYLKDFELEISQQIIDWRDSQQLKELLTMATEQNNRGNSALKYMSLTNFADSKSKDKDYLRFYSELNNITPIQLETLLSSDEIENLDKSYKIFKEKEKEFKIREKAQKEYADMLQLIINTNNIAQIDAFLEKYPNSPDIDKVKRLKKNIEIAIEQKKQEEKNNKSIEEWDRITSNKKYLTKKRIEQFMNDYPLSSKITEAKEELAKLTTSKQKPINQTLDLGNVKDGKDIERAIKHISNPTDEDKQKLEEVARAVYPNLNAKKKKQFAKIKLIRRWLGDDILNKILID